MLNPVKISNKDRSYQSHSVYTELPDVLPVDNRHCVGPAGDPHLVQEDPLLRAGVKLQDIVMILPLLRPARHEDPLVDVDPREVGPG